MKTVIIQNDLAAVRAVTPRSTDLMIIILPRITSLSERLALSAAQPAMREGGEVLLARSLPEAISQL